MRDVSAVAPSVVRSRYRSTPRPKNRRAMILQAASELFRSGGYDDVGMADIGAAVGTTAAALYAHFPSKAELLAAVMEEAMNTIDTTIDRSLDSGVSPDDALNRFVDA